MGGFIYQVYTSYIPGICHYSMGVVWEWYRKNPYRSGIGNVSQWYGSGMGKILIGVVWGMYGSGMGVVWEWLPGCFEFEQMHPRA